MKRHLPLALATTIASLSCTAFAQNIAKINGVVIPMSRAEAMIKEMAAQNRPDSPQLRQDIKEELINREIMMQEASKLGLARLPDVETQLDFARQNVLVRAYIQDYFKRNPITEALVAAEYVRIKQELGAKEFRTRHILVKSEDLAKGIIAKLKGGGKFEDLAKQSVDPGSKDRGGDLDWATPATFVPEFSNAMAALKKGEFTQTPVKTQYGFHIIRLDDVRDTQLPTIDEAKPRIMEKLQRDQFAKMLTELRSKASIE